MKETFDCLEESVKLGREKLSEVFMSHEPTPLVPGEKWGEADDDWRWSTSEGSSVEFSETDSSSESSSDEESDDEKERERSATKRRHLDLQQELERTGRLEISVQDALASRFPRGDTKKVILRLRPVSALFFQRSVCPSEVHPSETNEVAATLTRATRSTSTERAREQCRGGCREE